MLQSVGRDNVVQSKDQWFPTDPSIGDNGTMGSYEFHVLTTIIIIMWQRYQGEPSQRNNAPFTRGTMQNLLAGDHSEQSVNHQDGNSADGMS